MKLSAFLLLAVGACGGSTAPTTTTAPRSADVSTEPAPPLSYANLRIVFPSSSEAIEAQPDGVITADGKPYAKFVGNEIRDNDGGVATRCFGTAAWSART
jgi:hypothetical protein